MTRPAFKTIAITIAVLLPVMAGFGMAEATIPPNPQRPMQARDCREALARVREAAIGSPLISAEENRRVLLEAIADAERVCLGEPTGGK